MIKRMLRHEADEADHAINYFLNAIFNYTQYSDFEDHSQLTTETFYFHICQLIFPELSI